MNNGIFEEVVEFPDSRAMKRFAALVGLDSMKEQLTKEAMLLVDPTLLEQWSRSHYGASLAITDGFRERTPLFIFAGDVGCGKTALAESFGDPLARRLGLPVVLYSMSLNARGTGAVGEMTTLISAAFAEVKQAAAKAKVDLKRPRCVYILLVDEGDALAQSRELAQMHHEDRAGVNAMIRGIDDFGVNGLPVIVVLCTNRLTAIDPAIRRRAAESFVFGRPNDTHRREILSIALSGVGFSEAEIDQLVKLSGATNGRSSGFTFSDLTQRLLPRIVLDAFPDTRISFARARDITASLTPTPPFREEMTGDQ